MRYYIFIITMGQLFTCLTELSNGKLPHSLSFGLLYSSQILGENRLVVKSHVAWA